jgi:hypothetical protein
MQKDQAEIKLAWHWLTETKKVDTAIRILACEVCRPLQLEDDHPVKKRVSG